MFEQPDPSPEQRGRINMRAAQLVVSLAAMAAVVYFRKRDVTWSVLMVAGPLVLLLLMFGPIQVGRWLGRRGRKEGLK